MVDRPIVGVSFHAQYRHPHLQVHITPQHGPPLKEEITE